MSITRKICAIVITLTLMTLGASYYIQNHETGVVRAYGSLLVTFPSTPMFNEINWVPGRSVSKTIVVQNNDTITRLIGIKATNVIEGDSPFLSSVLSIVISENGIPLYGEGSATGRRTLLNFYTTDNVWLSTIDPQKRKNYNLTVSMDISADNKYQGKSTGFDLYVGVDKLRVPNLRQMPTIIVPTIIIPTIAPLPTHYFITPKPLRTSSR